MPFAKIQPSEYLGKIIADPKTFGFTLLTIFWDLHGNEGLKWHPATIQMELEDEFGIDIPAANFDRLMTAIMIHTSNSFFVSTPDFVRACVVLSGHHPTPNLLQLPDAEDLAWGITEGLLIHPPDDGEKGPFSHEITAFIGEVMNHEGIMYPPDVLRIASRDLSSISRVSFDYADDKDTFGDIVKTENEKTNQLKQLIEGRLKGLFTQLATLPLRQGNSKDMAKKLLENFNKEVEAQALPE